jgi:hypothetical protein
VQSRDPDEGRAHETVWVTSVETAGRVLLMAAAALAIVGAVLLIAGKFGLGRLPGDIVIHRGGLTIFIPIGSMLLLSLVGSLVLYLVRHL